MISETLAALTARLTGINGVQVFDAPTAGLISDSTVVVYADAGQAVRLKTAGRFDTVTASFSVVAGTSTAATTYLLADTIRQTLTGWRPNEAASPLTETGTGPILHAAKYGTYSLTINYQTTIRRPS